MPAAVRVKCSYFLVHMLPLVSIALISLNNLIGLTDDRYRCV